MYTEILTSRFFYEINIMSKINSSSKKNKENITFFFNSTKNRILHVYFLRYDKIVFLTVQ